MNFEDTACICPLLIGPHADNPIAIIINPFRILCTVLLMVPHRSSLKRSMNSSVKASKLFEGRHRIFPGGESLKPLVVPVFAESTHSVRAACWLKYSCTMFRMDISLSKAGKNFYQRSRLRSSQFSCVPLIHTFCRGAAGVWSKVPSLLG